MADKKVVELLINGGEATAGPPLGPALGPLGLNIMAVVNKINELTKDYAGMKVPVKVIVDTEEKTFEVTVGTPTASALIVAELKIEKGSGTPNSVKVGDLSVEQIVRIAKIKRPELLAKTLKGATKDENEMVLRLTPTVGILNEATLQHARMAAAISKAVFHPSHRHRRSTCRILLSAIWSGR